MIGWHVGARRGEMLKLEWSDVDLEKRTIFFRGKNTKNGEGRMVPIWGEMYAELAAKKKIRDEKFPAQQRVMFWSWNGAPLADFRQLLEDGLRQQAGLVNENGEANLLVHDLRRSAVRLMIQSGF